MADVVVVMMLRSFRKWNSGETAGFPPDQAKALVDQGAAQYVNTQPVVGLSVEEVEEAVAELDVVEEPVEEVTEEVEVEIERRARRYWLVYSDDRDDEGPYTRKDIRELGYEI